jgi:heterogeneous nuclear ribonucleoprotein A1/A3
MVKKLEDQMELQVDNKIFVGGLNYKTDEQGLQEAFSRFGKIINLRIVRNNDDEGSSRGFGFITFSTSEEAQAALAMDREKLDGRFIGVRIAHTPNKK